MHAAARFLAASLPAALLAAALAGCSSPRESGPAAASGGTAESLFASNGCAGCHGSLEQGGGGAPDLSHAGSNPAHDAKWFAEQIKDPRSHSPMSRMPSYDGRIAAADIETLAKGLASRK